jgi:hypothetical protein
MPQLDQEFLQALKPHLIISLIFPLTFSFPIFYMHHYAPIFLGPLDDQLSP